jgi:hypothetical protein
VNAVQTASVVGGVLIAWGGGYYLLRRYIDRLGEQVRAQQDPCDYVVFEAHPSHLPDLEADLADHRWRLAGSETFRSGGFLYRFEKMDSHSSLLSEVLDFKKSMKRTSNRKLDSHIPIKIKAQGVRDERHG